MKGRGYLGNTRGFALIELMLAVVLLSTLFLAVWEIFAYSTAFWRQAEHKVDMYDSLRFTLNHLGTELKYNPEDIRFPDGVLALSSSSELFFEIDGTPTRFVTNPPPVRIHYYCSSYNFYRQVNYESPKKLVENIQGVIFTYYNSDGTQITPSTGELARTVREVKIELISGGRKVPFTRQPGGVLANSSNSDLFFQINGNPLVDNPKPAKKIHYYCSSNTLYRQENDFSPQPLASDIQSVDFTYYNRNGTVVNPVSTDLAKTVSQVKIVLTAKKQNSTISPVVLVQKINLRSY